MNDAFDRLNEALEEPPLILHEQYPDGAPFVDWPPKVEEIREAVREAMVAVAEAAGTHLSPHLHVGTYISEEEARCALCELLDEIDRRLGKESESE